MHQTRGRHGQIFEMCRGHDHHSQRAHAATTRTRAHVCADATTTLARARWRYCTGEPAARRASKAHAMHGWRGHTTAHAAHPAPRATQLRHVHTMAVETHLGESEGRGGKQQSGDDSAHRAKMGRCLKVAAVRAIRIWACNNDPPARPHKKSSGVADANRHRCVAACRRARRAGPGACITLAHTCRCHGAAALRQRRRAHATTALAASGRASRSCV
jgi:hypothetical protein